MRIVIKIGTSTITHPTGRLNIRQMEALCKVLSDLKNAGNEVILVSSGAIGMGVGKLRLGKKPTDVPTKQAAAALSLAIQEGRMEKEYLAVLTRPMTEPSGTLRDLLYHDRVKNKTYVVKRKRSGVKEAVLDYETLATCAAGTLVRVRLHTGRTHQIRVQFASRGCPLTGDGKYGGKGSAPALWSWRLSFPDPRTGLHLTFSAAPDGLPWVRFPLSAAPDNL